jgi:RNA polymerase sigma-54 factor
MFVSHGQSQKQTQTQRISPQLIQSNEILQCCTSELLHLIEQEMADNPALESVENVDARCCAVCANPTSACVICVMNPYRNSSVSPGDSSAEIVDGGASVFEPFSIDEWLHRSESSYYQDGLEQADSSYSPLDGAYQPPSIQDRLLSETTASAKSPEDAMICRYLIGCLDERGWLRIDEAETLCILGVDSEALNRAISLLQHCDPPGIGARDLRECILLQAEARSDIDDECPIIKKIVTDYWDDFISRQFKKIARKRRVAESVVIHAYSYLKDRMTASPIDLYREAWDYKPDSQAELIVPDVVILRGETGFEVEVIGSYLSGISINERYLKIAELLASKKQKLLSKEAKDEKRQILGKISDDERGSIIRYVNRARTFIQNIEQRHRTIKLISEKLIEAQMGFIETGSKSFLMPLTRTELAQKSGVHESTVSRALLRKYVRLPNHDLVSFDSFFTSSAPVKQRIQEIVDSEPSSKPYSDEKIRLLLIEHGHNIARRTVVKYREELRIPPSYLRKISR